MQQPEAAAADDMVVLATSSADAKQPEWADGGANTAQTITAYQNFSSGAGTIAPRDSVSFSENPPFLSTIGSNANFLLNIGPMATGQVQPEFVERLHAIGEWTGKYGETIYGTRGGPISPRSWGVSTQKNGKTYLHILDLKDEYLALPAVPGTKEAHLFLGGAQLELKPLDGGLLLHIPQSVRDPIDTIVILN